MNQRILPTLLAGALATTAGTAVTGCKSLSEPASDSFASVQIQGHTVEQIRAATVVVFQEDGYRSANERRGEMVFEKEGSQWDKIAYGSWIDDEAVWIRVKASVVSSANGAFRLRCQAYRVRNKGDPVFEEVVRLKNNRSKPFQALLDKVAGQLKG
jgi:hypothetical protein